MPRNWFYSGLLVIVSNLALAEDISLITVNGSYRLRYESLDNAFRANASGGDQVWASRLLLSTKFKQQHWFGELELEDSRTWLDDGGTPLGTDDVNTLEPLQAYVGWQQNTNNESIAFKIGRFTMDIGSRRFVARNRFRNTLNAFTGVHIDWKSDWRWQAYYTLPVQRQPNNRDQLDNNKPELDQDFSQVRLWGLHGSGNTAASNLEVYLFALQENDQRRLATSDQRFYTLGGRWSRAPAQEQWDYEVEAAYQLGKSRSNTAPTNNTDLDHRAAFLHTHLGYRNNDTLQSRWVAEFDYASGDKNPNDDENNRFVTLFGARRFDYGPTGIYGPIIRGNIVTPGLRWEFSTSDKITAFIGYRAFWLAQERDGLTAAGLRDVSGNSGNFVGQQVETRWRISVTKTLRTELGGAYLYKGDFLKDAPSAPDEDNTVYLYWDINYQF